MRIAVELALVVPCERPWCDAIDLLLVFSLLEFLKYTFLSVNCDAKSLGESTTANIMSSAAPRYVLLARPGPPCRLALTFAELIIDISGSKL